MWSWDAIDYNFPDEKVVGFWGNVVDNWFGRLAVRDLLFRFYICFVVMQRTDDHQNHDPQSSCSTMIQLTNLFRQCRCKYTATTTFTEADHCRSFRHEHALLNIIVLAWSLLRGMWRIQHQEHMCKLHERLERPARACLEIAVPRRRGEVLLHRDLARRVGASLEITKIYVHASIAEFLNLSGICCLHVSSKDSNRNAHRTKKTAHLT